MSNLPQIFNYQEKQVRTVVKDGEPWFVAKDVCEVLEITDTWSAVSRLSEKMKGTDTISTLGGNQEMNIISEAGVYKIVFTSRKPEAEKFTDWVTSEVLPSIRKTGVYIAPTIDSKMLYQIAAQLEDKEKQIALLKPKAEFFDAVADSKDAIDIGTASKVLNIGIGRNRLFEILRQEGILMQNNQPYQKYVDAGYFRVIEQKFNKPDGSTSINIKTLVYQKGLAYIKKVVEMAKVGAK